LFSFPADIGAEDVAAALASNLELPILSSRVSRLVIDVNRPVSSDTLFRASADGKPVALNAQLTTEEKQDRIDRYWRPYRHELSSILMDSPDLDLVLSIHSFNPVYEGQVRECEVGVLYIDSKKEATKFLTEFETKGYRVVENAPWPASLCDIATPVESAGKSIIILEIRNDLASNASFRKRIVADIQSILQGLNVA
jgi:predicted N-formylglutamate amidohydrolase